MFHVVSKRSPQWIPMLVGLVIFGVAMVHAEETLQPVGTTLGNTTLSGYVDTTPNSVVPEPSSLALLAASFVAAGFLIHRRRS